MRLQAVALGSFFYVLAEMDNVKKHERIAAK